MSRQQLPVVGIIFTQFAPYHVDRCEAVAERLGGRVAVRAVEVAASSKLYAWDVSGAVAGAEKVTLIKGRTLETVPWWRRLGRELSALRGCSHVFVGLPYSFGDAIALSWLLRLAGKRVVAMTDSKFEDTPRGVWRELGKSLILMPYSAALVAGRRQAEYMHFLGFRRRAIVLGYDTVSIRRVQTQASGAQPVEWEERPFVFVGRFVAKKNLDNLLRAYALYRVGVQHPRPLVLVGEGELRQDLEALARSLDIDRYIEWPGFLGAAAVSQALCRAVALCLVSSEEQWGLVVNEAVALGIPAIVSDRVGARDALVGAGVSGYVVDPHSIEQIAASMLEIGSDEARWRRFSAAAADRAWLADTQCFADAVEWLLDPSKESAQRLQAFEREVGGLAELRQ